MVVCFSYGSLFDSECNRSTALRINYRNREFSSKWELSAVRVPVKFSAFCGSPGRKRLWFPTGRRLGSGHPEWEDDSDQWFGSEEENRQGRN